MEWLSQLHRLCEVEHDMVVFGLCSSAAGGHLVQQRAAWCCRRIEVMVSCAPAAQCRSNWLNLGS